MNEKAVLLFIATLKIIFTSTGSFCHCVLAHVYLWLVARLWMLRDVILGDELQNVCRSISTEKSENLLNRALDFPSGCTTAAHPLSPRVHGGKLGLCRTANSAGTT